MEVYAFIKRISVRFLGGRSIGGNDGGLVGGDHIAYPYFFVREC